MVKRTTSNPKQQRLIELLADPDDDRSYFEKFEVVGYSRRYGYKLTRSGPFAERVRSRVRELIGGKLHEIYRMLMFDALNALSPQDRARAARLILQACGEITAAGTTVNVDASKTTYLQIPDRLAQHLAERRAMMREVVEAPSVVVQGGNGSGEVAAEVETSHDA